MKTARFIPDLQSSVGFAQAMKDAGLAYTDLIADGEIHRFHVPSDRNGTQNGWYVYYPETGVGVFGSWKTSQTIKWIAKDLETLTPADRAKIRVALAQAQRQHDAVQGQRHQEGAERARDIWDRCTPALADHSYLARKNVEPYGTRQDRHGNLVVPISDGQTLTSLQFIGADGSKRFLSGGRISGCWFAIRGKKDGPILIGEGFATMATLTQETGAPAVIAYHAGNLKPVAQAVRRLNPKDDIVICGDDDQWTEGNPGRTKAKAAALDIGAMLLIPDFTGMDLSGRPTDWNDLCSLRQQDREVV